MLGQSRRRRYIIRDFAVEIIQVELIPAYRVAAGEQTQRRHRATVRSGMHRLCATSSELAM